MMKLLHELKNRSC